MSFFKKLATGQYSLAVTFWIFWFLLLTAISFTSYWIFQNGWLELRYLIFVLFLFFIKLIISALVISGIFSMLRTKINVWRILAFALVVIDFLLNIYVFTTSIIDYFFLISI